MQPDLKAENFPYQSYYCEENIWQMCGHVTLEGYEQRVVFISNATRSAALWGQRAAPEPEYPIIWDYHVILLARRDPTTPWLVLDLDTVFGFPLDAMFYLQQTFAGVEQWPSKFRPMFRVISADVYRTTLCSDRSHMRDQTGAFRQPPPPWPAIQTPAGENNLQAFIDMSQPFVGEVMDLAGLRQKLMT